MQGGATHVPAPCWSIHVSQTIDLSRSYVSQMALAEGIGRNLPRRAYRQSAECVVSVRSKKVATHFADSLWSTIHDASLLRYDCEDFLGKTLWHILHPRVFEIEAAADPTTSSRIDVSFLSWILRGNDNDVKMLDENPPWKNRIVLLGRVLYRFSYKIDLKTLLVPKQLWYFGGKTQQICTNPI